VPHPMRAVDFSDWIQKDYYLHYCNQAGTACLSECEDECPKPSCYRKREDNFHHTLLGV